ncbi:twin-arginine translocation signal domain-containing protein [Halostagnicola kamekurae]|uniref:Uncharacterized protein n=1 Tax=Halostagnicola kamekurae TaxID=619731 RepID=A0A1I6TH61_9EURY|nr:twin-arginine translocation signal domain-containing protein [Halostagnicola kamekurae]SFS88521.1 hypothetical protein SAMN04488556_3113 [Halostagnicola kamekurae]
MVNRRTFLTFTGASATAGLAGCSGLDSMTQQGENGASGPVTIQIQPDQEEYATLQEELQSEMEAGEISESEAREELETRQAELTERAVSNFEGTASNHESVSVEDADAEYGILRVTAPPETLIEQLQSGTLGGILPEAYYDQYLEQQKRREQQQRLQEQIAEQQESANETNESADSTNESTDSANESAE